MKLPRAIRAEILVNAIFPDQKKNQEQYQVYFKGGFKRNYQNDIDHYTLERGSNTHSKLKIHLNRNGFYDKLPEALFHRIDHLANGRTEKGKSGEKHDSEVQIQQKNNARKLFRPMENEFFHLNVLIDRFFLLHLQDANRLTVECLFDKESNWSADRRQHASLFAFNAMFYSIRGDIERIRIFLSIAFQTIVEAMEEQTDLQYINTNPWFENHLGKMMLGKNSVCGSMYTDHAIRWVYTVQADQALLPKLIESPSHHNILDFVNSSLMPAGIEGVFSIVGSQLVNLHLAPADAENASQYLGYNTSI